MLSFSSDGTATIDTRPNYYITYTPEKDLFFVNTMHDAFVTVSEPSDVTIRIVNIRHTTDISIEDVISFPVTISLGTILYGTTIEITSTDVCKVTIAPHHAMEHDRATVNDYREGESTGGLINLTDFTNSMDNEGLPPIVPYATRFRSFADALADLPDNYNEMQGAVFIMRAIIEFTGSGDSTPAERPLSNRARVQGYDIEIHSDDERDEDELREIACVVCRENERKVTIRPCDHECLCIACANKLIEIGNDRECPMCRGTVESYETDPTTPPVALTLP